MITVVKFGAVSVVLKLLQMGFLQDSFYLKTFTQWLVVLSLLFGSLIALKQKSLKRILAYSGVAQSGFMLIPILGLGFDGVGYVDQMIFYMFTYALFLAFVFSVITGIEHYKGADLVLSDLRGLSRLWPLGAMAILIGVIGLSGLPPLIGAVTKFFVLYASIQTGFYWVAFWALISSIVSMAYYLNFIHEAYFSDERLIDKALWDRPMVKKKLSLVSKVIILALLALSISLIYVYPFF
jgi:NADH-quinone oxidoreductase subunit N